MITILSKAHIEADELIQKTIDELKSEYRNRVVTLELMSVWDKVREVVEDNTDVHYSKGVSTSRLVNSVMCRTISASLIELYIGNNLVPIFEVEVIRNDTRVWKALTKEGWEEAELIIGDEIERQLSQFSEFNITSGLLYYVTPTIYVFVLASPKEETDEVNDRKPLPHNSDPC